MMDRFEEKFRGNCFFFLFLAWLVWSILVFFAYFPIF